MRRIYKLDIDELNAQIKSIDEEIVKVNYDLDHLTEFAVAYFESLIKKYGKGRQRKTEIKLFDTITAKQVAIPNSKLYINRAEGFIGTGLKKDEFLCDCSNLDDVIVFTRRGIMKVVRVADKTFIGKDILYAAVFQKNDERTTYNLIYIDGETGTGFGKRFNVTGITRDKEYDLTKGNDKSKVLYFSANPNGEAETVKVLLSPNSNARNKELDFSFEEIDIKGRNSIGNQVTKHAIRSVKFKEKGRPTLAGRKLWYDDVYNRLNADGKGRYVGSFEGDEKILVIYAGGYYELTDTELTQRFENDKILVIEKFDPEKIISAVYLDNEKKQYNVKRFKIETTTMHSHFSFIKEGVGNILENATTQKAPVLIVQTGKGTNSTTCKIQNRQTRGRNGMESPWYQADGRHKNCRFHRSGTNPQVPIQTKHRNCLNKYYFPSAKQRGFLCPLCTWITVAAILFFCPNLNNLSAIAVPELLLLASMLFRFVSINRLNYSL